MDSELAAASPDARCASIMQSQFGVIHESQALAAGMTRRMIRYRVNNGRWDVLHPLVYGIAGAPTSQEQRVMAAVLYGGAGAVAYGRCAAAMWDLAGGKWDPPEISSSRQLLRPASRIIAHRCSSLEARDVTKLGPVPVTGLCRAIIDLCGQTNERTSEIALDQALRRGVSPAAIRRRLEDLKAQRLPGVGMLRNFLDERDPSRALTDTELETQVDAWRRDYGFPRPVFQHWVELPDYGPARLDFAYPDVKVGVEADSYAWHSGRDAFERDRTRISEFASLGWIIIQTTLREIRRHPDRVANRLRRALARSL